MIHAYLQGDMILICKNRLDIKTAKKYTNVS